VANVNQPVMANGGQPSKSVMSAGIINGVEKLSRKYNNVNINVSMYQYGIWRNVSSNQ
jgi:hypothetical protein